MIDLCTLMRRRIEWCVLIGLTVGCGGTGSSATNDAQRQFTILGRLYGQYMSDHGGNPPQNAEEFSEFLQDKSLTALGIESTAELLISPRDGAPLVMLYGDQVIADGPGGLPWVGHEAQGLDGKKYFIGARGAAEEMSAAQIEQVLAKKP